jgi:hypothetical protein
MVVPAGAAAKAAKLTMLGLKPIFLYTATDSGIFLTSGPSLPS